MFTTSLPIQAGDIVAIKAASAVEKIGAAAVSEPAVTVYEFSPPLVDGGAASTPYNFFEEGLELGFNADIEYSPPIGPPAPIAPPPPPLFAPVRTCVVPKLTGKKLKAARKGLAKADCTLGTVTKLNGASAQNGQGQEPEPESRQGAGAGLEGHRQAGVAREGGRRSGNGIRRQLRTKLSKPGSVPR